MITGRINQVTACWKDRAAAPWLPRVGGGLPWGSPLHVPCPPRVARDPGAHRALQGPPPPQTGPLARPASRGHRTAPLGATLRGVRPVKQDAHPSSLPFIPAAAGREDHQACTWREGPLQEQPASHRPSWQKSPRCAVQRRPGLFHVTPWGYLVCPPASLPSHLGGRASSTHPARKGWSGPRAILPPTPPGCATCSLTSHPLPKAVSIEHKPAHLGCQAGDPWVPFAWHPSLSSKGGCGMDVPCGMTSVGHPVHHP